MSPTKRFGAPQGPGQAAGNAVAVALVLGIGVAAPLGAVWTASSDGWARKSGFAQELAVLALAVAGLFGTWGLAFAWRESRQGRLGFFRWYGRGQQEKVFIEAGGRRYVLEPETPAEFIRAIEAARAGRRP